MCRHLEGLADPSLYRRAFGVEPAQGVSRADIWPGYKNAFIRSAVQANAGGEDLPARQCGACLAWFHTGYLISKWLSALSTRGRSLPLRSPASGILGAAREAVREDCGRAAGQRRGIRPALHGSHQRRALSSAQATPLQRVSKRRVKRAGYWQKCISP
jgi:hypothetical protein